MTRAFGEWIVDRIDLGWLFLFAWHILQQHIRHWPVAAMLMLFALTIIYYMCSNVEHDRH
ncbi:MAG: hypothetical protein OJF47_001710 [Nitrospira sp.]|jgi:hypothetical protein|nr:MAG: hypothetical protein OJF47_001710 [Nitrospira sp.]